jgi:two-component system, LuxR family, response regulator FixJ
MTADRQVYLVDDDDAIRRSAGFMLKTSGFRVETFTSGTDFLKVARELDVGCVLLDVRMPEIDGLAVQSAMKEHGIALPVIVMTGHGDVTVAVAAMKAGAVDFLEKPFEKAEMMAALDDGFARIDRSGHSDGRTALAVVRLAALTSRERDVLHGLVHGLPNKTIAYNLGISPRTVEIHRAHLMTKLNVRSLSEALRIAFSAGWSELTGHEVGTTT